MIAAVSLTFALSSVQPTKAAVTLDGYIAVWRPSEAKFYRNDTVPPDPCCTFVTSFADIAIAGDKPVFFCYADENNILSGFQGRIYEGIFSNGWWLLRQQIQDKSMFPFAYGVAGDTPLCGNWDDWENYSPGVKRGNVFYLNNEFGGASDYTFAHGNASDIAVVGDWNGDGRDTIGLFRPSTHTWYINNNLPPIAPNITFSYGQSGDKPIAGDWNKDGVTTVGVVRGNTWYLNDSSPPSGSSTTFSFGKSTDIPVPRTF